MHQSFRWTSIRNCCGMTPTQEEITSFTIFAAWTLVWIPATIATSSDTLTDDIEDDKPCRFLRKIETLCPSAIQFFRGEETSCTDNLITRVNQCSQTSFGSDYLFSLYFQFCCHHTSAIWRVLNHPCNVHALDDSKNKHYLYETLREWSPNYSHSKWLFIPCSKNKQRLWLCIDSREYRKNPADALKLFSSFFYLQ